MAALNRIFLAAAVKRRQKDIANTNTKGAAPNRKIGLPLNSLFL